MNHEINRSPTSESLAWSFYSERGDTAINTDMTKVVRLVEQLSGEPLVHVKNLKTGKEETVSVGEGVSTRSPCIAKAF